MAGETAPDNSLIVISSPDAFVLGVLSSSTHAVWALAAGSRLGIDGTPRYNKGPCFEAFPFPDPPRNLQQAIAEVAERIDRHRKEALARSAKVGMTVMYNIVEKLRAGGSLTAAEREVHTLAACGTLRDLHDDLDRLVAKAYGWSWPEPPALVLERLVALHDQRVREEQAGRVQWLRPAYQLPRFARGDARSAPELALPAAMAPDPVAMATGWPGDAVGQIFLLREMAGLGPLTVDEAVRRLTGAPRAIVLRHLETLANLGEVLELEGGRYGVALAVV
jgi:hypothetical protein